MTELFQQAVGLAFSGGIATALYRYYQERDRNRHLKLDVPLWARFKMIDFLLLFSGGLFAGMIGYYAASWIFDTDEIILALTGLAAVGGLDMLTRIKEMIIGLIGNRVNSAAIGSTNRRSPIDPGVNTAQINRASYGHTDRRSGYDRRMPDETGATGGRRSTDVQRKNVNGVNDDDIGDDIQNS